MGKKGLGIILAIAILVSVFPSAAIAEDGGGVYATVTRSQVYFDGIRAYEIGGFNIERNNYFKLRDLANAFSGTLSNFDVAWNAEKNEIEILTGRDYTVPSGDASSTYYWSVGQYWAVRTGSRLVIDGETREITAYNIDGSNYFKLRDLAELIPFDLEWDAETESVLIYSRLPEGARRVATSFSSPYSYNLMPSGNSYSNLGTMTSYMAEKGDGTIDAIRVNFAEKTIVIDSYDEKYELISSRTVAFELDLFGAFYSGERYNYIVFGQENQEESATKEVIRIVKYDKAFNRVDSVAVKDCFTVRPFYSTTGRMSESGDELVLHTARMRYRTEDGLNHQSQLTVIVDTNTMKVKNSNDLGRFQRNHVSHSFDQLVRYDGKAHILVDLGDAYPRSVVLMKSDGSGGYLEANLLNIAGGIGDNYTGVGIGGLEVSSSHYLVALASVDQSGSAPNDERQDVIVCAMPKNSVNDSAVNRITIAKYTGTSKTASVPMLCAAGTDKYLLTWQEFNHTEYIGDSDYSVMKYVFLDKTGNPISETATLDGYILSRCEPVIYNNAAVWFTDNGGGRVFYTIPLD